MTDRRRWSQNESDKLIELVQMNYDFLTSGFTPKKTKVMVDEKWKKITEELNSLGEGPALNVEKVKIKCQDEKSKTKKAVSKYRRELEKTGGGPNTANAPTVFQSKIASFIGNTVVDGIPGTADLDTSDHHTSLPAMDMVPYTDSSTAFISNNEISASNEPLPNNDLPSSTPSKRQKLSVREKQNQEFMESEKLLVSSVKEIKEQIKESNRIFREGMATTNQLLGEICAQMKRFNDHNERLAPATYA